MKSSPAKDPAGHVKLSVSDYRTSKAFYGRLFQVLGYPQVSNRRQSAGWVSQDGFGVWVAQAGVLQPKHTPSSPGLHHLCLKARTLDAVNDVYLLVRDTAEPPRFYPEYTANYYAVYFSDPDGMKLEVAYY